MKTASSRRWAPPTTFARPRSDSAVLAGKGHVLTLATWCLGLLVVSPFLWMIIQALQPNALRFSYPPAVAPSEFTVQGFVDATAGGAALVWLRNSGIVALSSTLCSILLGSGAAYVLARYRSRSVRAAGMFVLASQMVPPVVLMIPLFTIITSVGLFDSLLAVILGNVAFTLPVVTWMLSASFRGVPIELEEAAMVDGCTRLGALLRVTVPVALPGVAAAAAFSFNWAWQEFLFSRLVLSRSENWVGGVGIASFFGMYETPWNTVMAATTLFTAVPVVFFLLAQRRFVDSVGGGVKG